jgi:hypothetical protein
MEPDNSILIKLRCVAHFDCRSYIEQNEGLAKACLVLLNMFQQYEDYSDIF